MKPHTEANIMLIYAEAELLCVSWSVGTELTSSSFLSSPHRVEMTSPTFENLSDLITPLYHLVMEITFAFLKYAGQPAY